MYLSFDDYLNVRLGISTIFQYPINIPIDKQKSPLILIDGVEPDYAY